MAEPTVPEIGLRHHPEADPRVGGLGRVVSMEILHNDYAVANLIRTRKVEQLYSRPLSQLLSAGTVDVAEAEKWTDDRKAFPRRDVAGGAAERPSCQSAASLSMGS